MESSCLLERHSEGCDYLEYKGQKELELGDSCVVQVKLTLKFGLKLQR